MCNVSLFHVKMLTTALSVTLDRKRYECDKGRELRTAVLSASVYHCFTPFNADEGTGGIRAATSQTTHYQGNY